MKVLKKLIVILIISLSFLFISKDSNNQNYNHQLSKFILEDQGEYVDNEIIVDVKSYEEAKSLETSLNATIIKYSDYNFALYQLNNNRHVNDLMEELSDQDLINRISLNYLVKTSAIVNDPYFRNQTYIPSINLNTTWSLTKGEGVTVAVIDTGIDIDHPDLKGRVSSLSYNATTKQVGLSYVNDTAGHGSSVSGVIVATQNNRIGITGIAPMVDLMVIKCEYTDNSFSSVDLIEGIYYAANNGADIINMSWGAETNSSPYKTAIEYAISKGVILVAAAGNSGKREATYPASDPNVISVGATDGSTIADFSNYGQDIDVVAPGSSIFTTNNTGSYSTTNGTSLASPIVVASIALYLSKNQNATIKDVKDMLFSTTSDLGNIGRDITFGYGQIDVDTLITSTPLMINYNYLTDEINNDTQLFALNKKLKHISLPVREDYTFAGWYIDSNYQTEFKINQTVLSNNTTLYAKWIKGYHENYLNEFLITNSTIDAYIGSAKIVKTPSNFNTIGPYAFYNSPNLEIVSITNSVIAINEKSFYYNQSLLSVIIPSTVINIKANAFEDNYKLIIRSENLSALSGWDLNWNPDNKQVIWNYLSMNYLVRFYDEDGITLLKSVNAKYGTDVTSVLVPSKPSTAQYTYTFTSWDKDVSFITADINVKAIFNKSLKQYTVYFYDEDGLTLIGTATVDYGTSAISPDFLPKTQDEMYTYTFTGWDQDFSYVTSDISTKLTYAKTLNKYNVRFYDHDNNLLKEEVVEYGNSATAPMVLDQPVDENYILKFTSWDKDFSFITSDLIIYANYTQSTNQYTVNFVDEDGTIYKTEIVKYGEAATAPNPTKESDQQYTYVFSSWDKDFLNITTDLTIIAIYTKVINQYTVTFYNDDKITVIDQVIVDYGSQAESTVTPIKESDDKFIYTFSSWDKDLSFITEDLSVYPTYLINKKTYTVTFISDDKVIATENVNYQSRVESLTITKEGYTFAGWYLDDYKFDFNTPIESNITLTAKWVKPQGCIISSINYAYLSLSLIVLFIIRRKKTI